MVIVAVILGMVAFALAGAVAWGGPTPPGAMASINDPFKSVDFEAFHADKLEGIFRAAGKAWEVELLPSVGHIPLTLEPSALAATVRRVGMLQQVPGWPPG